MESFGILVEGIIYGENLCEIVLEFKLVVQKEMFLKTLKKRFTDDIVGQDLGPNCLQRLSAGVDRNSKERVNNDCWHFDESNSLRDWLK